MITQCKKCNRKFVEEKELCDSCQNLFSVSRQTDEEIENFYRQETAWARNEYKANPCPTDFNEQDNDGLPWRRFY